MGAQIPTREASMPATRGPIPKRSDQRRRVNAVEGLEQAPGAAKVRIPAADKGWHPIARDWYRSLRSSGQASYYEPSDWQTARLLADQMSRLLYADELNASLLNAIIQASRDLMTTEGQRRRLRLELTREQAEPVADPAAESIASVLAIAGASA